MGKNHRTPSMMLSSMLSKIWYVLALLALIACQPQEGSTPRQTPTPFPSQNSTSLPAVTPELSAQPAPSNLNLPTATNVVPTLPTDSLSLPPLPDECSDRFPDLKPGETIL